MASLGLVKALDGFDLERGQSFIAYAAPTILGELRRHFRDRVWDVRLPRGLQERTMAVHKAAAELSDELGRTPTVPRSPSASISTTRRSRRPCRPTRLVARCRSRCPEAEKTRMAATIIETLGQTDQGYDAVEAQLAAEDAQLDERERRVLELRFEDDLNQYEIGRRLGVSQMQVSRIMRGALRKLLAAVQAKAGGEADA